MANKYALVTGGSRGIGRAISIKLGAMGYPVLINYRQNQDAAQETLAFIEAAGGAGELFPFDVADPGSVQQAFASWRERHPDDVIEVLVNNAGIRQDNLMLLMEADQWKDVLDTNLGSFFYITREVLKGMIANRFGRIVNIVSLSGIKGMPGQTNYAAAKAGVIAATKSLAQEVGRRRITVNAVAPGFIKTEMIADIEEADYKKIIPVARFGTPEEVAEAVGFLASKGASYITGEVIAVNGGLYT